MLYHKHHAYDFDVIKVVTRKTTKKFEDTKLQTIAVERKLHLKFERDGRNIKYCTINDF